MNRIKNVKVLDRTKIDSVSVSVTVNGKAQRYGVTETPTMLIAHMNGIKNWDAVYVLQGDRAYERLVSRIKEALRSAPLPSFVNQR